MINLDFLRLRVCFSEVYEPEEDSGASPGMDGFPVFETDMGTVGMITCYESWFPDTIRILALRGADLVLFSSEGYFPALVRTPAIVTPTSFGCFRDLSDRPLVAIDDGACRRQWGLAGGRVW